LGDLNNLPFAYTIKASHCKTRQRSLFVAYVYKATTNEGIGKTQRRTVKCHSESPSLYNHILPFTIKASVSLGSLGFYRRRRREDVAYWACIVADAHVNAGSALWLFM
jgi:hypothetical protein